MTGIVRIDQQRDIIIVSICHGGIDGRLTRSAQGLKLCPTQRVRLNRLEAL